MSSRYPRYNNYGGYNNNFRRYNNNNYSNRNWTRSTGSAKPVDPRKYGDYSVKDEMVLSGSVSIVSWLGRRIICFYHAGVFYFGRKALKLLENQAQFFLPTLDQVSNNYYANTADGYSFGMVPHVGDSEKMVCVGQEQAYWLLFNFLASNVFPITFEENNSLRIQDMFESQENENAFRAYFNETFANVTMNPFNPANKEAIMALIGNLFEAGLLQVQMWEKDYRRNYRSWTEALEMGRQPQPQPQRGENQHQQ